MKYIATNAPANQAESIAELTKKVAPLSFSEVLSNILNSGHKVTGVSNGEITAEGNGITSVLNFAADTITETASEELLAKMNLPEGVYAMNLDEFIEKLGI